MCSIMRNPAIPEFHKVDSYDRLTDEKELLLMKMMGEFTSTVAKAAKAPQAQSYLRIISFRQVVSQSYYNVARVNNPDDPELTNQRIGLVKALQITLSNALNLLGVSAPESM